MPEQNEMLNWTGAKGHQFIRAKKVIYNHLVELNHLYGNLNHLKQIAVLKGGPAFQEVIKNGGNPTGKFYFNAVTLHLIEIT